MLVKPKMSVCHDYITATYRLTVCLCMLTKHTLPVCPWPSRRPGTPPSPQYWPVPASDYWSHAGGAPSGHSTGPPTAHTCQIETGTHAE